MSSRRCAWFDVDPFPAVWLGSKCKCQDKSASDLIRVTERRLETAAQLLAAPVVFSILLLASLFFRLHIAEGPSLVSSGSLARSDFVHNFHQAPLRSSS